MHYINFCFICRLYINLVDISPFFFLFLRTLSAILSYCFAYTRCFLLECSELIELCRSVSAFYIYFAPFVKNWVNSRKIIAVEMSHNKCQTTNGISLFLVLYLKRVKDIYKILLPREEIRFTKRRERSKTTLLWVISTFSTHSHIHTYKKEKNVHTNKCTYVMYDCTY